MTHIANISSPAVTVVLGHKTDLNYSKPEEDKDF